jgi:hypothetical protein
MKCSRFLCGRQEKVFFTKNQKNLFFQQFSITLQFTTSEFTAGLFLFVEPLIEPRNARKPETILEGDLYTKPCVSDRTDSPQPFGFSPTARADGYRLMSDSTTALHFAGGHAKKI